ncbi:cAMP-dependent protein kinase inhibitor alpha [Grus japonensis]|uniref:Keratin n=1 Tax=Grus japonensis TaxID=30415 RepID=A0ABC9XJN8_GRUJA
MSCYSPCLPAACGPTPLANSCNEPCVIRCADSSVAIQPSPVTDLALGHVELHAVRTGPPLQPVKVPLDGIPSLQRVDHTTQLGVVGKLAEGALNPTVHDADKDVKQCRSQYRPRGTPLVTVLHLDTEPLTTTL